MIPSVGCVECCCCCNVTQASVATTPANIIDFHRSAGYESCFQCNIGTTKVNIYEFVYMYLIYVDDMRP